MLRVRILQGLHDIFLVFCQIIDPRMARIERQLTLVCASSLLLWLGCQKLLHRGLGRSFLVRYVQQTLLVVIVTIFSTAITDDSGFILVTNDTDALLIVVLFILYLRLVLIFSQFLTSVWLRYLLVKFRVLRHVRHL